MFFRNSNLRRATGLLGVVLALLSGFQQSHALCYLAGCHVSSVSTEKTVQGADHSAGACSCSQSSSNTLAGSSSEVSASVGCKGIDKSSESCPCPPTCWCHFLSTPFGLPLGPPVPLDLVSQGLGLCPLSVKSLTEFGQLSSHANDATLDASTETTSLRCAKLCRFLI